MLLALAALAGALWSSDRAAQIQGPVTLVATAGGVLWVGADERLWRVGADGTLRHDDDLRALGVPGTPATLTRLPQGGVVASVRHDPTLYLLDAASARVVGRIRPQWPAELAEHGSRAIHVALHPDGRIAIATGGGHAVALFAADGRFIARTAPGFYRYTNGLWWAGDALWTSDTNRTQLKRLDGGTLALQETVQLEAGHGTRFLGPAREHARRPDRVAIVRYANGMTVGRVAVVEGQPPQERALDGAGVFEPHDVDWLGDDVVATDGRSHRVLRIAADGGGLAVPFGGAEVQRRIDAGLAERARAQRAGGSVWPPRQS